MKFKNKEGVIDLENFLAEVFSFQDRPLTNSDSPETIPGWDSFQSLIMFQELENEAGVSFDIEDLKNIRNVGDIKKVLDRYKVVYLK